MPELPDLELYREALEERVMGHPLVAIRLNHPFLLRTAQPPISDVVGRRLQSLDRMGKRLVFGLEADYSLVLHLMVAGRLHWVDQAGAPLRKSHLAAFDFSTGTLSLSESGSKKRASLRCVHGTADLAALNPGGLEVLGATLAQFSAALQRRNHTLKRALTDPRILSGIGNAYSDEILHRAGLSPLQQTQRLQAQECARLYEAARLTLQEWLERLRHQAAGRFPSKVTAFRDGMAVHGRYGKACPVCGALVQRIRYAHNETNYCPGCQTGGRLLADRALSRLLKKDWPRSLDALEDL